MPDILDGKIQPGKVFDATTTSTAAGYKETDDRKRRKVLVAP
jgi:hypothetical protein